VKRKGGGGINTALHAASDGADDIAPAPGLPGTDSRGGAVKNHPSGSPDELQQRGGADATGAPRGRADGDSRRGAETPGLYRAFAKEFLACIKGREFEPAMALYARMKASGMSTNDRCSTLHRP